MAQTGERPGARAIALASVLVVSALLLLRFASAPAGSGALQRAPESDPSGRTSAVGAIDPAALARSTQHEVEPPSRAVEGAVAVSSKVPDDTPSSSDVSTRADDTAGDPRSTGPAAVTFEITQGWPPLPAVGAKVHMERIAGGQRRESLRATADVRGFVRFSGLAPGLWEYHVQLEGLEREWRSHVALGAGDVRHVSLADETEERGLAVMGRFVDEEGAPVEFDRDELPQITVYGNGAWGRIEERTRPSADGTFRIDMSRCAEITVHNFDGDRYEPELAHVPFGTRELVLRRVERSDLRTVVVEVRDSVDQGLLPAADLVVYEHEARATLPSPLEQRLGSVMRPSQGRFVATLRARPEMRLAVCAHGYAPRFLDLPASGATLETPLVVHLEHGGLREVHVFDRSTGQPIAGAELVIFRDHVVGTTDGDGRMEVRADQRGSLGRAGYTHEMFDPCGPLDRVYLTPE